jgi:hypothetical protein
MTLGGIMKLRKAIKLAAAGTLVGLSAGAMAADPVNTGAFSMSGGVISSDCTAVGGAGAVCSSTPITDSGFMQRNITTAGGRTFIQTILTEGDSTNTGGTGFAGFTGNTGFADESFVEMGGGEGIISKQNLGERAAGAGVTEDFNTTSSIHAGQFRVIDGAGIQMDMSITETDSVLGDGFNTAFQLIEIDDSNFGGNVTAQTRVTSGVTSADFSADFVQQTYVVESSSTAAVAAGYKKLDTTATLLGSTDSGAAYTMQTLVLNERTGAAINEDGSSDAGGTAAAFSAGDTLVHLQIAQTIDGAGVFGLDDFVNETVGVAIGIDSFASNAVPFQTVTFTSGGDPFATF